MFLTPTEAVLTVTVLMASELAFLKSFGKLTFFASDALNIIVVLTKRIIHKRSKNVIRANYLAV